MLIFLGVHRSHCCGVCPPREWSVLLVQRACRKCGKGLLGRESCGLAHDRPKKYGPYGKLFFFLTKKEPTTSEKVVGFERVTSSDDEDGRSVSDEEGEHNVENVTLCSFAHHACSPL